MTAIKRQNATAAQFATAPVGSAEMNGMFIAANATQIAAAITSAPQSKLDAQRKSVRRSVSDECPWPDP